MGFGNGQGEFWNTAATLEQLIQDIQAYHGEEATVFFQVVMCKFCSRLCQRANIKNGQ